MLRKLEWGMRSVFDFNLPPAMLADKLRALPREQAVITVAQSFSRLTFDDAPEKILRLALAYADWQGYAPSERMAHELIALAGQRPSGIRISG